MTAGQGITKLWGMDKPRYIETIAVTNSAAARCMAFLIDMPAEDLAAPLSVLEAVNDYDLSISEGSKRQAVYALRHAIESWFIRDRAACVALLGDGLGVA